MLFWRLGHCVVEGAYFLLISAIYIPFMLIIVMFVAYMPKAAMFKKMQASNELA